MTETRDPLEGVDASPDRDVRVTWGGRMHPTLDDIRAYYKRNRIAPPWYNPSPRFGLREPISRQFWFGGSVVMWHDSGPREVLFAPWQQLTEGDITVCTNDFQPPPTPEPSP